MGREPLKLGDNTPEPGSANGVTGVTIPVPRSVGRGGGRGIFFEGKPRVLGELGKTGLFASGSAYASGFLDAAVSGDSSAV